MVPTVDPLLSVPVIVTIEQDQDPLNPMDEDGQWKLYSFSRKHVNYEDPETLGLGDLGLDGRPVVRNPGLRRKLERGLAFFVSYYEHGGCAWSRLGKGPQCPFDSVRIAGLLIWEDPASNMGAKTFEDRAKDADAFLESYTAWCNGEAYGYSIEDPEEEVEDSCWGFLAPDMPYMFECIKSAVGERPVRFVDETLYLAKAHWKGRTAASEEE